MLIANPIYDSVFKYLLEDIDIAKGILSAILDENILHLTVKPQETISEIQANSTPMTVYRLDFKAVIETKDGYRKKILIELQKTKRSADVMRFRRYLAENYQKEDDVIINNEQVFIPLEIVTVYLLGFKLENIITPILKVSNCFFDVSKQEFLVDKPKEPFVDLLNHESYTIQIPRLPENNQTELENALSVFNQKNISGDRHQLNIIQQSTNPLTLKIVERLNRAISNSDIRVKMNLEDEIERTYGKEMNELLGVIADKDNEIANKDNEIEKLLKELESMRNNKL